MIVLSCYTVFKHILPLFSNREMIIDQIYTLQICAGLACNIEKSLKILFLKIGFPNNLRFTTIIYSSLSEVTNLE